MYWLDTNIVSELRKPKPDGAVVQWLQEAAETDLHISAVTIGEIQAGIELTREQDETKAAEIEQWLELVSGSYNVIPMDAIACQPWRPKWRSDTRWATRRPSSSPAAVEKLKCMPPCMRAMPA